MKVGELPAWLSRRSKNPVDWGRAVSRVYWRWAHKYYMPKYAGLTPIIQLCVGCSAFFYFLNYPSISESTTREQLLVCPRGPMGFWGFLLYEKVDTT